MNILSLLVLLIVFCVVIWAAMAILNATAIPEPLRTIILVVIVLLGLVAVLNAIGFVNLGSIRVGS